jgi:hypothetical protein
MNRIGVGILVAVCLGPEAAWAKPPRPASEAKIFIRAQADRFSPHYYTVRNIFRNHRRLAPASPPMGSGLLGGAPIPISEVSLESDVVFQGGVYEFHARLRDTVSKVRLRRKDGRWFLEVLDDFSDRILSGYVLEH